MRSIIILVPPLIVIGAQFHAIITFRSYSYSKGNDRQIQLAITAQKSVSLQFEAAGRDAQTYSKELYLWGQEQTDDIKDGTHMHHLILLDPASQ